MALGSNSGRLGLDPAILRSWVSTQPTRNYKIHRLIFGTKPPQLTRTKPLRPPERTHFARDLEESAVSLWRARGITFADASRPRVMGIVNVTPDSFSDGGRWLAFDDAVAWGDRLVAEGADLLDIGGESSRPGAAVVPVEEEVARVVPVIEALAGRLAVPISVDTTKPEVAARALEAGASILNDIRGLDDPRLLAIAAESGAGVVLMHMQGTPQTMQVDPRYDDVVREVRDDLARRIDRADRAGIPLERISIDPGIGFGKTFDHNLKLLRNLETFATLGCVLLMGTSRKGFLGKLAGRRTGDQTVASITSALACASAGARVVRVHDVGPTVEAFRVWEGHRGWSEPEVRAR
jgi:dihydropteroate synthase